MPIDHHLLQQFLADQGGVLSVQQAGLCGYSATMCRRRVASGEWVRVLPGVLSPLGEPGPDGRIHAALLWAGAGSFLHGASALWWWGLIPRPPESVSVIVPPHRRRGSHGFVTVHRHVVPDADRVTERGIRVESKPYAILFATRSTRRSAQTLLDRALLREYRLEDFERILHRNARAAGVAAARRLLKAAADGTAAESERLLARLLRDAGITGWTVNRRRRVGGAVLLPDFTFAAARLVIEIDGWAFHCDPDRFTADRARQNLLVNDGWMVLRFTWAHLTERPDEVLSTIRRALARRSARI